MMYFFLDIYIPLITITATLFWNVAVVSLSTLKGA